MPKRVEEIFHDALALPATDRALLVDSLIASLDRPDARIDALWAREVEDRLTAFDAGKMKAIPAEQVFAEFDKS